MRLLDRYIGAEFARVFIFSLLGFVFFITTFEIQSLLALDTDVEKSHIYLYLLYTIPRLASWAVPASLLFGVCFTTAQFTVSREMAAIQNAGVSFYRATAVMYIAGIFLTCALFLFQNFIASPAEKAARREMSLIKKKNALAEDLIWQKNLRGLKGYYFLFFYDRDLKKVFGGFNYLEMRDANRPLRMIRSESAALMPSGEWLLKDVMILNFAEKLNEIKVDKHETYMIRLPEEESFFANPSRDPRELNVIELLKEIERRDRMGFDSAAYRVQLHAGIAFPLMCVVLSIVGALAGSLGGVRASSPLIRSILISAGVMFVYILVFNIGKNMGTSGILPPWAAGWGSALIFLSVTLFLAYKRNR